MPHPMAPLARLRSPLRIALAAGLVAAAGALAWWAMSGSGQRAPQVTFTTIQGEVIIPKDLDGKVTLVNFWATDCEPCLVELPRLAATYNRLRSLGLQTVAVAMAYDRPDRVIAYAQQHALPFKVAIDPQGEVARQFGDISFTPTTFLIDKHGRIVRRWQGEPDYGALERLVEQKLEEKA